MKVTDKTVRFEIGVWLQDDGHIHIAATDPEAKRLVPEFHTTVNKKEGTARCHRNLYGKLFKLLEGVERA